jgi:hypothetical protein
MFWFRNMQEFTGVVDRHEIRHICSIWTKCFDQCLLKRFLGYWNKHYEVVHGLSRREMHQRFQRHINKRAYRRSIRLCSTYVGRQKLHIHAVTINKHKNTLLDGILSHWSFEADKTLSNKVVKFIHSLQMSLRKKCFFMWRESSFQQKIMDKKGKFLAWRLTQNKRLLNSLDSQRLPRIIWLLLRRARVHKRRWKTYHDGTDDNSAQHLNQDANPDSRSTSLEGQSPMIQYDCITTRDI